MRKLGISFVLGLVVVVSAVQTPGQSAVPVTLIEASRLLDPCAGNVLAPAARSASHAGMPPLEILRAVTTRRCRNAGLAGPYWSD